MWGGVDVEWVSVCSRVGVGGGRVGWGCGVCWVEWVLGVGLGKWLG
jgi:hypothetical protein